MLERILVLVAVGACIALGVTVARSVARRRLRRLQEEPGSALLAHLGAQADGRPTLVQFSTPSCAACHTAQSPAVVDVETQVGAGQLRVVHVDAAHQPDVAHAFGIMTVPSTVVLDRAGRVTAVNHGFATSQQLVEQLQTA